MDVNVFIVSIVLSALGVFIDLITTCIAIRDFGIRVETNPWARKRFTKGGLRRQIMFEVLPIFSWAVLDSLSLFNSMIWFSLMWGIARGLVGLANLQAIVWYRVMGKERYKEEFELRRLLKAS